MGTNLSVDQTNRWEDTAVRTAISTQVDDTMSPSTENTPEDSHPELINHKSNNLSYRYTSMLSLFANTSGSAGSKNRREQDLMTPLFSRRVDAVLSSSSTQENKGDTPAYPQYALLGMRDDEPTTENADCPQGNSLVFTNMNTPWSAFICGSQGAGKSHTLACLLENALLQNDRLGNLPHPLAGIVFHYDKFSSGTATQVCEAAYLCSSGIPVTVLASPSNIWTMKTMYSNLPGMPKKGPKPQVVPLYLTEKQLDITRILKLMAVDPSSNDHPLYMESVISLLRSMAMEGNPNGFSYSEFRQRLKGAHFSAGQSQPLNVRLELLESFMIPSKTTRSSRPAASKDDIWTFTPGSLTIVDLSDPFISETDACAVFSICLSIFLEARNTCGRVVALDEAHKFLTQSGEAQELTDSLTSIMREQRHTGTRVFIATQEPTLAPTLIDLANVTIIHRFLSPAWYKILKDHLAGVRKQHKHNYNCDDLFETIVTLETGQALIFCPTALLDIDVDVDVDIDTNIDPTKTNTNTNPQKKMTIKPLGSNYAKIRVRSRLTTDGGKSILASDTAMKQRSHSHSRTRSASPQSSVVPSLPNRGETTVDVPMHIVSPTSTRRIATAKSVKKRNRQKKGAVEGN